MTSEPHRWRPIGGGLWVDTSKLKNSEYNHMRACKAAAERGGQQCMRCWYE